MNRQFIVLILLLMFSIASLWSQSGFIPKYEFFSTKNYVANTIVFKLKPEYRNSILDSKVDDETLNKALLQIGIVNLKPKFHSAIALNNPRNSKLVDLSLIYELKTSQNTPLKKAISTVYQTGMIDYAEPIAIHEPLYTPSDSLISFQYYLTNIDAFAGWDISKGDTNVVIGITDTGIDTDHPDLVGNIKYNYADPINGVDDDFDGYVDNYMGWDLGDNDNDPFADVITHGELVSGVAGATTDNITGIAGTGFKCKILPIKIADANGTLSKSFDGIVYAADHGCQVINCSWGSAGSKSQYEQDIINYATFNKNCLVVAAAGNNNDEGIFYPASYENVLSVGGTDMSDHKWITNPTKGSNYNCFVDISAPGADIYSTTFNDTYTSANISGTSFSCPIVSACAAIVKAHFPSYTALQVGEQLKVTADLIDTIPANASYAEKLGFGRVNLFKALTDTTSPSVVMVSKTITDNNDESWIANDTLRISGDFINYLQPTTSLNVTLTTSSTSVAVLDGTTNLGAINTLISADNQSDPFLVKILPSITENEEIEFKLRYADGSYSAYQCFTLVLNASYITISVNDVALTVTSKGRLGYNEDGQIGGVGFTYQGLSLFYAAGLMVGNASPSEVSDDNYGEVVIPSDNDFGALSVVQRISPSVYSDFDTYSVFNDDPAGANSLGIEVVSRGMAWAGVPHRKYVILQYVIKNKGAGSLDSLYAGILADWDVPSYDLNRTGYDAGNKLGYVYSTDQGNKYAGIQVLSSDPVTHYGVDWISGGAGGIDLFDVDGYSSDEKYETMATNRHLAGVGGNGNDVFDIVSTGPFTLASGDSVTVAFAMLAGDSLVDLQNTATNAQQKYDSLISAITGFDHQLINSVVVNIYPNPTKNSARLVFSADEPTNWNITLYDLEGKEIVNIADEKFSRGTHTLKLNLANQDRGVYFCKFVNSKFSLVKKLILY